MPGHGEMQLLQNARAAVLIDVQYLYYSVKMADAKNKVDYGKLMDYMTDDLQLQVTRAIAFILDHQPETPDPGYAAFIQTLKNLGIDCVFYKARKHFQGHQKADCTVPLTSEALVLAQKNDVVVLVTGSGEYTYLVDKLRSLGTKVVALGYAQNVHKDLRACVDVFVDLGDDILLQRHHVA